MSELVYSVDATNYIMIAFQIMSHQSSIADVQQVGTYNISNTPGKSYSSALKFTTPPATDNSHEIPNVTCNLPSPYTRWSIGQTSVTCVAVDSSGNNATCKFVIIVRGAIF